VPHLRARIWALRCDSRHESPPQPRTRSFLPLGGSVGLQPPE
jgi:hypothetical protein